MLEPSVVDDYSVFLARRFPGALPQIARAAGLRADQADAAAWRAVLAHLDRASARRLADVLQLAAPTDGAIAVVCRELRGHRALMRDVLLGLGIAGVGTAIVLAVMGDGASPSAGAPSAIGAPEPKAAEAASASPGFIGPAVPPTPPAVAPVPVVGPAPPSPAELAASAPPVAAPPPPLLPLSPEARRAAAMALLITPAPPPGARIERWGDPVICDSRKGKIAGWWSAGTAYDGRHGVPMILKRGITVRGGVPGTKAYKQKRCVLPAGAIVWVGEGAWETTKGWWIPYRSGDFLGT